MYFITQWRLAVFLVLSTTWLVELTKKLVDHKTNTLHSSGIACVPWAQNIYCKRCILRSHVIQISTIWHLNSVESNTTIYFSQRGLRVSIKILRYFHDWGHRFDSAISNAWETFGRGITVVRPKRGSGLSHYQVIVQYQGVLVWEN